MCIYEVNIEVAPEILNSYLAWLPSHIREILKIRGFRYAEMWRDLAPAADGWIPITIQYRSDSQADVDSYLKEHAPRLRADAAAAFGERFRARRRVLINGERLTLNIDGT